MRLQAVVAGILVTGAVVLLVAGVWVLGAVVGLLAVLPVAAFVDSVVIWIGMRNPRHWPNLPPTRSMTAQPNLPSLHGSQPTGWVVRRGVKWSWFAPGFMIGWPTWFRARWVEARNFIR
jgi:hypothetical protein